MGGGRVSSRVANQPHSPWSDTLFSRDTMGCHGAPGKSLPEVEVKGRNMVANITILDDSTNSVRYQQTDDDGLIVATGSIPLNEWYVLRNKVIHSLPKGVSLSTLIDYIVILSVLAA